LWSDLSPRSKEAVITPLVEQDWQWQDKFLQEVAKKLEVDVQQRIANSLEALAWKGLGPGEATGAGKGLQQEQGEEEGAKEKMPKTMAGATMGAETPASLISSPGLERLWRSI
ncbi:hypothetical protein C0993_010054, partial [Termitomyces sp. T159_Od127]